MNSRYKLTSAETVVIIGESGAGKSTLLKAIAGEIETSQGQIEIGTGERIALLKQDQFAYDEYPVLETVLMGHPRLYAVMKERDAIYS